MPKTPWDRLRARPNATTINVVVETPRGSRNKYKYDPKLGLFRLNRVLPAGTSFPFDFGYIPCTRGGDDDPLDVLLLMDEPAFPGCLVRARLIGMLHATKEGVTNDRFIAVSLEAKGWAEYRNLTDLPRRLVREIEQFFVATAPPGSEHAVHGFRGPVEAERTVNRSIELMQRMSGAPKGKKKKGSAR